MRALIQRVQAASVSINGRVHSEIDKGLLLLLGLEEGDTEDDISYIVKKTIGLRIFNDDFIAVAITL